MLWTALDTDPAIYRSEDYDLVHSVAGFGISLVRVYPRGGNHHQLAEFTGHNALKRAQDWCAANCRAACASDSTKGREA